MNGEFGKKAYGFIDGPVVDEKDAEVKGNTQPVIEIAELYAGAEGLGATTDREFLEANGFGPREVVKSETDQV